MKNCALLLMFFILSFSFSQEKSNDSRRAYLGQKHPGETPEIFAPGIISSNGTEVCITFSSDGRECYFQRGREILVTRESNSKWTQPEVVTFSGKFNDGDPFLSSDGQKLFFTSERPVNKNESKKNDTDIWYVKRDGQKWSQPYHLGNQINTDYNERTPTVSSDGTLYFHVAYGEKPCDLFYSKFEDYEYSSPKLVADLNTDDISEADASISQNKDYILFLQNGVNISYSDKNGNWKTPVNLKEILGPKYENAWPRVTFDGKYLFFSSFRPVSDRPDLRPPNIYWVSFEAITKKINSPYLGQTPPGEKPELFASGLVSTKDNIEFAGTFSPDFTEYFFTRRKNNTIDNRIYLVQWLDGQWTKPIRAPFGYDCFEFEPHITPAGDQLFYGTRRPIDNSGSLAKGTNIWITKKTETGWSPPKYQGPPFDEAMFVCMADDGTLYNSGLTKSEHLDGKYSPWEKIAPHLHGPFMHPCIEPDESFIIFDTDHPLDGRGKSLLISFRKTDGSWGDIISFRKLDHFNHLEKSSIPMLTPDSKYLFFSSGGDIYWVDAKIIEELRPVKDIHSIL